jgi:acetyl esterase
MTKESRSFECISYKMVQGLDLQLFVVKPPDWHPQDKRMAIMWIHGGGWKGGTPEMMLPQCHYFANRGIVSFSLQYRLLPNESDGTTHGKIGMAHSIHDCIEDCTAAIRYLRTHAEVLGIDPDRIVAAGDSAGGYLAICLATMTDLEERQELDLPVSSKANCVVSCNGIAGLTRKWKYIIPELPYEDEENSGLNAEELWLKRHQNAKLSSPLFQIRSGQPPMLIMHGLKDEVVVPEDAYELYEAYLKAGNTAELVLYPDLEHAFILYDYSATTEQVEQALATIHQFISSYMAS